MVLVMIAMASFLQEEFDQRELIGAEDLQVRVEKGQGKNIQKVSQE